MSFNLSNKVNNLANLINSTIPSSGVVVCNNLTATTGAITNLASTAISSATLTCGNITGSLTYNLNPATGMSVPLSGTQVNISLATSNANNYIVGQIVFVQGNSNGLFNNVSYTITAISSSYNLQCNNPTSIAALEVGGGGTVSGGIITTRDLTATNLNGKINVAGGTSNSGNLLLCNNTTSTTGNFDLLTDSNQHLRFGSNLLTIGGATNGGIAIPGTAGSIVCNQYTTNANTKMILNSTETANGIIEIQRAGVKTGIIDYANASFPLQLKSESGISLDTQANGGINIACDGTGVIQLIAQSSAVRAIFGGTSTTIGSTAAQGMTFVNASGNAINFYTSGYNIFQMGTINCAVSHSVAYGTGYDFITFYYNSVAIGSVHQVSSGAITINYSSDYRLKENIQPINDCLTVLNKLKPISFNWKNGGEYTLGFLAHEFAEVFPNNVVGQKDAVNADGTIKSQQMSDNCCIPLLVSCVQEQNKIIVDMRKELDELKLLVNQLLNK